LLEKLKQPFTVLIKRVDVISRTIDNIDI